jgi:AcrR family transcriptional regulator
VFAEKGFRDATIAEICKQAHANIASVNYYFRSKEGLYTEAWRAAFQASHEAHPADDGVPADAAPEARLRGRIRSMMKRMSDPASLEFEIMHKELANPTGLLNEVKEECIEPLRRAMQELVRELLGEHATDQQVMLCAMSTISQCMHQMIHQRIRAGASGPLDRAERLYAIGVEGLVDHIVRFSLAAIRGIRKEIEAEEAHGG